VRSKRRLISGIWSSRGSR